MPSQTSQSPQMLTISYTSPAKSAKSKNHQNHENRGFLRPLVAEWPGSTHTPTRTYEHQFHRILHDQSLLSLSSFFPDWNTMCACKKHSNAILQHAIFTNAQCRRPRIVNSVKRVKIAIDNGKFHQPPPSPAETKASAAAGLPRRSVSRLHEFRRHLVLASRGAVLYLRELRPHVDSEGHKYG